MDAAITEAPALHRWVRAEGQAKSTTQVYDLISRQVPCDARILPNVRSEGVFEAVTGRRSVLEGMSPYLRPDMLTRVLSVVREAKGYFHHPVRERSFLRSEHVDYVMTLPPGDALVMGQYTKAWAAPKLPTMPWLDLVDTVNGVSLYRVDGAQHTLTGPDPPRTCNVAFGS
jgi:hypothetical protein